MDFPRESLVLLALAPLAFVAVLLASLDAVMELANAVIQSLATWGVP